MASDKKLRKQAKLSKSQAANTRVRQRDGDRRRRTNTDPVREALERKQMTHDWNIDVGPIDIDVSGEEN